MPLYYNYIIRSWAWRLCYSTIVWYYKYVLSQFSEFYEFSLHQGCTVFLLHLEKSKRLQWMCMYVLHSVYEMGLFFCTISEFITQYSYMQGYMDLSQPIKWHLGFLAITPNIQIINVWRSSSNQMYCPFQSQYLLAYQSSSCIMWAPIFWAIIQKN